MPDDSQSAAWQTSPCPPWCSQQHQDDDHPDDRYHSTEALLVPTIVAQRDYPAGRGQWILAPEEITIITSRHEETTPLVTYIGVEDRRGQSLQITPESAVRLAEALLQHLASLDPA